VVREGLPATQKRQAQPVQVGKKKNRAEAFAWREETARPTEKLGKKTKGTQNRKLRQTGAVVAMAKTKRRAKSP